MQSDFLCPKSRIFSQFAAKCLLDNTIFIRYLEPGSRLPDDDCCFYLTPLLIGHPPITRHNSKFLIIPPSKSELLSIYQFNSISINQLEEEKMKRCLWAEGNEIFEKYHDEEWGVPVHDDKKHFEFLVLEGAQAGLSWLTILKRRVGYTRLYKGFDPVVVAKFSDAYVEKMLKDEGIIRNRQKVLSSIRNAKVFLEIQKEFGSFDKYIWGFVDGKPIFNRPKTEADYLATSDLSDEISQDLKSRGMSFVGSTIVYAHLQATGIINDHMAGCFRA